MTLIIIFLAFWGIGKACESVRANARQKEAERQRRLAMMEREQIRQAKEQAKLEKEQERQQRQAERERQAMLKEEAKAEAIRQKQGQAQADVEYLEYRLEQYSGLVDSVYQQIDEIENQMEINEKMRKYDLNKKLAGQKEKLQRRVLQYEAQIYSMESKLAKANYILAM